MTWKQLLASGRVRAHVTSKSEIDDLRAVVARDLQDANLPGLSDDRRFATAYNAALQLGKMVVACAGYRVVGAAHHQTTFEAVEVAMGKSVGRLIAYFQLCRRKRNTVDYDLANVISDVEATEIVARARGFSQRVERWISRHYPRLKA